MSDIVQQRGRAPVILIGIALIIFVTVGGALWFTMQPSPDVDEARLQRDPVLGNPDAPVTIVQYGAYSCFQCQFLHESGIIERVLMTYEGQVNFVFRDFPFVTPAYDQMAAELSQCVLDQGQDLFWVFHDLLYTEYFANTSQDTLIDVAVAVGGDEASLNACMRSNMHAETVQYDAEQGLALGVRGTPTLYVNDQVVFSPTEANIVAAVEAALQS